MEEVEQGLVHDWDEVQLVFRDPHVQARTTTTHPEALSQVQRTCGTCDVTLSGKRSLYCSPVCRQRAYRQRLRSSLLSDPM